VYSDTGTAAQLTSTLQPNLVNEAYIGVSCNSVQFHAPWTADSATQANTLPSVTGVPYILNLGSEVTSPIGTSTSEDPQGRLQGTYLAGEKISWLRGKHAIKVGFEFRNVVTNSFVSFNVVPRVTLGVASSAGTQNINTISGGVENLSNLTQLQLIGKNSPHPGIQPWNKQFKNFAPVVGMTWALPWLGANKTILRAGYSIAYERYTQVLFDQLYGYSAPGLGQAQTYAPPSYQNLVTASLPLTATGLPLATVPINDNNSSAQTLLVADNGLKLPYIQNWNISLGREVRRGLLVDVPLRRQ